jgi:hypothetical protein
VLTVDVEASLASLGIDWTNMQSVALGAAMWSYALICSISFNSVGIVILGLRAYTLTNCLRACASHSRNQDRHDACIGFEYNAELCKQIKPNYGNCWLKNTTVTQFTVSIQIWQTVFWVACWCSRS